MEATLTGTTRNAGHQQGPAEVEGAQHVLLPITPAQRAAAERADDVPEPDQREAGCPVGGIDALVGDVGGQMGGDERDVKAAHEEPGGEKPVSAVAGRFSHRAAETRGRTGALRPET